VTVPPVITVLLVDDDELIRVGLRAIIDAEADLEVVGEAADGAEVVPLVVRRRPAVVLMDVRMPAIDGIQATRHLLATVRDPPRVLVITTFENDDYVYEALRSLVGTGGLAAAPMLLWPLWGWPSAPPPSPTTCAAGAAAHAAAAGDPAARGPPAAAGRRPSATRPAGPGRSRTRTRPPGSGPAGRAWRGSGPRGS
jgi:CheY-like chemotaxis protein